MNAKVNSLMLLLATLLYLTGCTQPKVSAMLKDDAQKKEIISAILSDEQVSAELIDSLMNKNHGQMMIKMNAMMSGDKMMQGNMMGKIMDMCKTDSAMCKKMMGMTMDMCDADQSKCNMMMGAMQSHPNVLKSVQSMCDMKGMKMK